MRQVRWWMLCRLIRTALRRGENEVERNRLIVGATRVYLFTVIVAALFVGYLIVVLVLFLR